MIIFDYGHTLCFEESFDGVRGCEAVMKYTSKNPNNLSAKEISEFFDSIYYDIGKIARASNIELHNLLSERLMYEYLQIEFSISLTEIEKVFWDNAAPGIVMPHAKEVLTYLKESGIRSGVISNISFSGENLTERINELYPENDFEFVIASSDYLYRKPHPMIFKLALKKANLCAGDVWYCGDSPNFDAEGAHNVGIFPVWYHSEIECDYRDKNLDVRPEFDHLYIRDWLELIDNLEVLHKK